MGDSAMRSGDTATAQRPSRLFAHHCLSVRTSFPDAEVVIEDLRGDGDHYACRVIAQAFVGKSRVQQHQMVYKALGGRMGGELHALALQTSAPTTN